MKAVGALGFAGAVAAALAIGPAALGAVAVAAAAVALLDLALLLGRADAKTVLPAAAVPGLALPVLAVVYRADELAWGRVGELFAVAIILGFALVLLFGRRRGVVVGLGAAMATGLLVGLGTASLLLLHALPDGWRWVLALVVLSAAADGAVFATAAVRARRRGGERADTAGNATLLAAIAAIAVVTAGLLVTLDPPLPAWVAAVAAAGVAVAALGGDHLRRVLVVEAGLEDGASGIGTGVAFGAVDALLLSAPIAYVLARAVPL